MRRTPLILTCLAALFILSTTSLFAAQPPVINDIDFSPSDTPLTTEVVTLSVTAKSPDNLQLKIMWSYGDGTESGSGTTVTHTYAAAGDYTVTVTISDGVNPNVTKVAHIQAIAPPPVGSPLGVNQGESQENPDSGVSSTVVSSVGGIVELFIDQAQLNPATANVSSDFGDGGRLVNGQHPRHMYIAPGIYIVTSTVKDESSGSVLGMVRKTLEISSADVAQTLAANANLVQPQTHALIVSTLSGKFNLANSNKIDMVTASFTVELPAGLRTQQKHDITVSVGNVAETVSLDHRGMGQGATFYKKVKVAWPKTGNGGGLTSTGQSATVTVTMASADLAAAGFDTEGVSKLKKRIQPAIQFGMLLEGIAWSGKSQVTLKVSKNSATVTMSTK